MPFPDSWSAGAIAALKPSRIPLLRPVDHHDRWLASLHPHSAFGALACEEAPDPDALLDAALDAACGLAFHDDRLHAQRELDALEREVRAIRGRHRLPPQAPRGISADHWLALRALDRDPMPVGEELEGLLADVWALQDADPGGWDRVVAEVHRRDARAAETIDAIDGLRRRQSDVSAWRTSVRRAFKVRRHPAALRARVTVAILTIGGLDASAVGAVSSALGALPTAKDADPRDPHLRRQLQQAVDDGLSIWRSVGGPACLLPGPRTRLYSDPVDLLRLFEVLQMAEEASG